MSLWLRLLRDLAVSVPLQLASEAQRDAKHAFRIWGARPWHTGFMIAALALAIGANTGVFSVVNALLLRSLPFSDADRLASLRFFMPPDDTAEQFHRWHQGSSYLEEAAVFEDGDRNIGLEKMIRAHIAQTSYNFFSVLGVRPLLGRTFSKGEDQPGHNNVAVIGYGLWQELFAGDARELGATIQVEGRPVTIVGIAPPGFDYPNKTLLWTAVTFARGNNGWATIVRLKNGEGWQQTRAAFNVDASLLSPPYWNLTPEHLHSPRMIPLRDELAGPVKEASLLLMAGVGLILLIACANVANIMMARTSDRSNELAIRSAVGASPGRLMQQILTECLFIALISSTAGLAVAYWVTKVAAKFQSASLNAQAYSVLDWRVLSFAIAATISSAVLFGLLPCLAVERVDVFAARGSNSFRRSRVIREVLVAAQVMLTIVLLTASVSVGRAFSRLTQIDRGFDMRGPVTVSVSLDGTTHGLEGHRLAYFEQALSRIRRIPGVRSASATDFLPLYSNLFLGGPFGFDGRMPKRNSNLIPVLADYFSTMSSGMLYGREFADAEVHSNAPIAVVNETFARQFSSQSDVLGHMVIMHGESSLKIVGVVKGIDFMSEWISGEGDGNAPEVFVPAHSPGVFASSAFVARVDGRPEDRVAAIRDAIQAVDPKVPVFGAKTMADRLDEALSRPRFYRTSLIFFAGFALLLAVVGIYGVVSYAVVQRTREMGVRLALGTTQTRVRRMLLRQSLVTVSWGLICGVMVAVFSGRLLESLLEGANTLDIGTFTLSVMFVLAVASLSIWIATQRVARMDIAEILRAESFSPKHFSLAPRRYL